jgi:hypothetical protein
MCKRTYGMSPNFVEFGLLRALLYMGGGGEFVLSKFIVRFYFGESRYTGSAQNAFCAFWSFVKNWLNENPVFSYGPKRNNVRGSTVRSYKIFAVKNAMVM